MGELSVVVRLFGEVVEDRVVPVAGVVRLGESARAVVAFPGADLAVLRSGRALSVRGRELREGESMDLALGSVDVTLAHAASVASPVKWAQRFDGRFLAVALVAALAGTWLDAAGAWIRERPPPSADGMGARAQRFWWEARDAGVPRGAAAAIPAREEETSRGLPALADGPPHMGDDHLTGTAWRGWAARAVPADRHRLAAARERIEGDRDDALALRILARSAYDAEDFEEAVRLYLPLVARFPEDRDLREWLARTLERQGRHREEAAVWRAILDRNGDDPVAIGGLAVALARVQRFDDSLALLDRLQAIAPNSPLTDETVAIVAGLQGNDRLALESLDRAFAAREQLSREMQIELRRDIAVDPALASLRRGTRLRAMIHRYLGAAGPRPLH